MKAIVLASGAGKRLRPLTNSLPKPLIKVGDKTLLDYQLESLVRHGITRIVVTTGPFKEKLEEHILKHYRLEASFVHNPEYETTNNIYSLWLTQPLIDDDVLLLHSDLLFEDVLVGKLLQAGGNCVLVNKIIPPPEKDFKALIEGNRVVRIAVDVSGTSAFFCAPMYKFSKADFSRWMEKIDEFVRQGNVICYAEDALNEIAREVVLRPLYFDEFCMEVDTPADLEIARSKRDKLMK